MRLSTTSIDSYLVYCKAERGLDAKTIKAYRGDLMQFLRWNDGKSEDVYKDTISNYLVYLNSLYRPRTVKRKMASLKAYASYSVSEELDSENPFDKIKIHVREPLQLPRTIPLPDLEKIFHEPKTGTANALLNLRNRAILEILIATGMRVCELCALNREDCDLKGRSIRIFGKGKRERVVQLESDEAIASLEAYKAAREAECIAIKDARALFLTKYGNRISEQSVRNMIAKVAQRCGTASHITPHMFRHTFATLLLEEDVDIRYIQNLLGHSSIKTTEIYTHVSGAKQREILRQHNPRNIINNGS